VKLLIVIPRQSRTTGNHVTASRFAGRLRQLGWEIRKVETDPQDSAPIVAELRQQRPDLALLLHAWRSGRPWLQVPPADRVPFAVLMTGTDINRDLDLPDRAAVIRQVHQQAATVIVQNRIAFEQLHKKDLPWLDKLRLLPPGIELGADDFPLRERLRLGSDDLLLLHPASIRPVKGNLELLRMSAAIFHSGRPPCLAFCGPILDHGYGAAFITALKDHPRARYLGEIPCAAMPSAMRQADLILNNSVSEGVANALVEAATLGRPILARDIPGNRAVVRPGYNGLLYTDDDEFQRLALKLLENAELRRRLSRPDPHSYAAETEGRQLAAILTAIIAGSSIPDDRTGNEDKPV